MRNPDPIKRAWRLEQRRKELGSDNPRCFYCGERELALLEADHPVTEKLDPKFKRVVCRNIHRKLELKRDVAGLTHNGRRTAKQKKGGQLRRYLLLLAEDQESIAEVLVSPDASREEVAAALRETAASLRRKARKA